MHRMSPDPTAPPSRRALADLFLISLLLLFLELACIRWFPAHVLFLTFFTNTVLLACFLGMSVGCLAAGHRRDYLRWTPLLLCLALLSGYGIEALLARWGNYLDVGHQEAPQEVFFGTEYHVQDVARFPIPIEAVLAVFFVLITLALVGPGQELGRALTRVPNRVQAYTVNILGSLAGIVLFAVFSRLQLAPFWWFLPVALGLAYYLLPRPLTSRPLEAGVQGLLLVVLLLAAGYHSGAQVKWHRTWVPDWLAPLAEKVAPGTPDPEAPRKEFLWSPYYRIDYEGPPSRLISVNLIGHQKMVSREEEGNPAYAYPLPHLLNRDAGGPPFQDVLIIGAGSGNDVSRALQWGARHVDAVEIDPVIQALGRRDHPDRPYDDPRVSVHLDDGRNFLRSCDRQYDLVIYALVDSLVLQSSYSNLRLESYLFTEQAFRDVKRVLKPGGVFAMYNYFRQGWIVARLRAGLEAVFGADNPLVLPLPFHPDEPVIQPDDLLSNLGYTMILAGETARFREAFARHRVYRMRLDEAPGPNSPNGFEVGGAATEGRYKEFGPATIAAAAEPIRTATDDWPFLYLRRPMVPDLTLRGMAIMGGLGLALILLLLPRPREGGRRWSFDGRMFFLGAGFMLIETKAVVHMALLFGGTWSVNSVVFFAVLVMILLANLYVLKWRPQQLWPYYLGLFMSLAANVVVPLDAFLGLPRLVQVVGSCVLVFAPILFAGVVFAVAFARTAEPDRAFGANIAGALLGGLTENTSMLLGFQYLVLVALAFYALSGLLSGTTKSEPKAAGTLLPNR
jgi:SAM-dependent methyltransferase